MYFLYISVGQCVNTEKKSSIEKCTHSCKLVNYAILKIMKGTY